MISDLSTAANTPKLKLAGAFDDISVRPEQMINVFSITLQDFMEAH